MIETPQVVRADAQLTAALRVTVPRNEIQKVMRPGLGEIMGVLGAQGIASAGPWFTHHLCMDPAVFDFEICVPTSTPVVATGLVKPSEWPSTSVVRTVYQGPFEGLGDAWGELSDWIELHGHRVTGDLWERYLVGPESSSNPADGRTELNKPLAD